MSGLKIGLVASNSDESAQLALLLEKNGAELKHNIQPEDISAEQINDQNLHVWLLSVDDDSWHDAIDHLLDESEIPVYFSEPGTLAKQSHPEFWCANLMTRLYEITGLEREADNDPTTVETPQEISKNDLPNLETAVSSQDIAVDEPLDDTEIHTPLSKSLLDLELTSVGLPSDIAAELVSELESLSPVLCEEDNLQWSVDSELSESVSESVSEDIITLNSIEETHVETSLESDWDDESIEIESLSSDEHLQFDESLSLEIDSDLDLGLDDDESELIFESTENELSEDLIEQADEFEAELELELESNLDTDFESGLEIENPPHSETSEISATEALKLEAEALASELSLELTEEESTPKISGRAQYHIDESDELASTPTEDDVPVLSTKPAEEEVGGLALDFMEEEMPTRGRATFKIDDGDESSAQPIASNTSTSQVEAEETELSGLSLQPMETDNQPAWLDKENTGNDESIQLTEFEEDDNLTLNLQESNDSEAPVPSQDEFELSLEDDEFAFSLEQMEIDSESSDLNEQSHQGAFELDSVISETELLDEEMLEPEISEFELDATVDDGSLEIDDGFLFDNNDSSVQEDAHEISLDDIGAGQNDLLAEELSAGLMLDEAAIREIALEALHDDSSEEELQREDEYSFEANSDTNEEIDLDAAVVDEMLVENEPANQQSLRVTELKSVSIVDTPLEFEIPMLDETAGNVEFEEKVIVKKPPLFTPCWIIGASLGGPAAVKRFLNCLPADIDAAFVIAQHIDENFLPVLAEILTSSSQFKVTVAQGSNEIKPGKVYLAPLKGKLIFLQDGSILVDHSQKWSGPYSPCINDVIESVCQVYRERCGAIIFSGMGEDGVSGASKMRKLGGQVWAQSTETCANPTMPEAVINEGETDFIGTPEELAQRFIKLLKGSTSLAS